MRKPRQPRMVWTEAQITRLIELFPNHTNWQIAEAMGLRESQINAKTDHLRKFGLRLAKSAEHLSTRAGRITAEASARMASTRFKPGHASWNKGSHYKAGGRSPLTRFKPGNRPHTWLPVGTERVCSGILQVKVSDTGHTPQDWQSKHQLVWIAAHGPLPKDHIVCFRDGDRTNFALANLELVSRAELMRRNSIHTRVPEDLKPIVRSLGQIRRRLRSKLFQTLDALTDKASPMEPDRARAIVSVASVMVDSAKVEVDYLRITGHDFRSGFIAVKDHPALPAPNKGLPVRN